MNRAPDYHEQQSSYPKTFRNEENLPLRSLNETLEFPLLNQTSWQPGMRPGPVRLFYPPDKTTDHIDVGYHDLRQGVDNRCNMNL